VAFVIGALFRAFARLMGDYASSATSCAWKP